MRIGFSLLLGIGLSVVLSFSQGRNSISGLIFGESRTPLENAYVELLDELGTTITQTRTNGTGRCCALITRTDRHSVALLWMALPQKSLIHTRL